MNDFINKTRDVLRSEKLMLSLYGSEEAQNAYRQFTRRHRLLPFVQSKSFGAALYRLPEKPDDYLAGKSFEYVRRKRRKAIKSGFRFGEFYAPDYAAAIVEINRSLPMRQGHEMPAHHTNPNDVEEFCRRVKQLHGVFDGDGQLKAYTYAPVLGDIFLFSRLLGHGDSLDRGVMYLLITETTLLRMQDRDRDGYPTWSMYDMFWGATRGLRYFKTRLGFRPYRVRWTTRSD